MEVLVALQECPLEGKEVSLVVGWAESSQAANGIGCRRLFRKLGVKLWERLEQWKASVPSFLSSVSKTFGG